MSRRDAAPARGVAWKTLLAMGWFSAMFFVLGPWLALRIAGSEAAPALREAPAGSWVIFALAAALVVVVVLSFVRAGQGTPVPIDPPRRFVRTGVWALSRNPMYGSYLLLVASEAWLLRSGAVAIYAAAFFALIQGYLLAVEEPGLRRRFGAEYTRYCAEVPRWLSVRSVRRALARPSP